MKKRRAILLSCLIAAALMVPPAIAETPETLAIAAAEAWLSMVDRQQYDDSWEAAASLFKNAVPRKQWKRSLEAVRPPLGELVSRKVASAQYATSLPGAPDGEYVVIRFATEFTGKRSTVETVTPMKAPDGQWRVSGYFIK